MSSEADIETMNPYQQHIRDKHRPRNVNNLPNSNILLSYVFLALFSILLPSMVTAGTDPQIVVDTHSRTLSVWSAGKIIGEFKDIAIGRGGASSERHQGDNKTPLGTFHIKWLNMKSRFHIFLGLDYPTVDHAMKAYQQNHIKNNDLSSIKTAFEHNTLPPQDTSLGGYIGIHGLGDGSLAIHKKFNWTRGCIALTNEQIERLARMVHVGTEVIIR